MAEMAAVSEWVAPAKTRRWSDSEGRALVEAFLHSGDSLASFARRHGLQTQRLKYWVDRVTGSGAKAQRSVKAKKTPVSFAEVRVVSTPGARSKEPPPLEVVIGAAQVRVPREFDAEHLARVLAVLSGGAAC